MSEIAWTDLPSPGERLPGAEIRRCPPGGTKPAIILSEWIVGNEMHWFNGRSFPHLKTDCPACAAKRSKVWKGYLTCLDPLKRTIFIQEITPNCIDPLCHYKETFGSLRGAELKLHRSATKANGRVTAETKQANLAGFDLPPDIQIREILERMWQTDHRPNDRKPENPRVIADTPNPFAERHPR